MLPTANVKDRIKIGFIWTFFALQLFNFTWKYSKNAALFVEKYNFITAIAALVTMNFCIYYVQLANSKTSTLWKCAIFPSWTFNNNQFWVFIAKERFVGAKEMFKMYYRNEGDKAKTQSVITTTWLNFQRWNMFIKCTIKQYAVAVAQLVAVTILKERSLRMVVFISSAYLLSAIISGNKYSCRLFCLQYFASSSDFICVVTVN